MPSFSLNTARTFSLVSSPPFASGTPHRRRFARRVYCSMLSFSDSRVTIRVSSDFMNSSFKSNFSFRRRIRSLRLSIVVVSSLSLRPSLPLLPSLRSPSPHSIPPSLPASLTPSVPLSLPNPPPSLPPYLSVGTYQSPNQHCNIVFVSSSSAWVITFIHSRLQDIL